MSLKQSPWKGVGKYPLYNNNKPRPNYTLPREKLKPCTGFYPLKTGLSTYPVCQQEPFLKVSIPAQDGVCSTCSLFEKFVWLSQVALHTRLSEGRSLQNTDLTSPSRRRGVFKVVFFSFRSSVGAICYTCSRENSAHSTSSGL